MPPALTSLNTALKKRPRVLQVFHNLSMGGAETWLIEMLRRWHETKEVQCDFVLTSDEPGTFDDEARRLGAVIHVVPFGKGRLASFSRGLRRVLQSQRYDAIHDHQDRISGWHFALGWPRLPPIRITHVHNASNQITDNYEVSLSRRVTASLGKFFMRRFTTHIAGTSYQVIEEYGFASRNYSHIPKAAVHCAFNCERFSGCPATSRKSLCDELHIPGESKLVLFAGRMDQSAEYVHPLNQKNSALAIDIMSDCIATDGSIHFLMAGATTEAFPILQNRIASRGQTSNFHFLGVRKDIERLMLAGDLLLFPSRAEGLGMVAVEAQAAGLRVLASSTVPRECVVVPDLVAFMDLGQPKATWADEIRKLLALPKPNAICANAAVARSAFSVPVSSQRLVALYSRGQL